MPINRAWGLEYLQMEREAARWLIEQGVAIEQVRELTWGAADETTRTIRITSKEVMIKYDLEWKIMEREEKEKEFHLPAKGSGCEYFFFKSRISCGWMFTKERPRSWRKEKSRDSLFTPDEFEEFCGKDSLDGGTTTLTDLAFFGNIEISKLNITKTKTQELLDKAVTPD